MMQRKLNLRQEASGRFEKFAIVYFLQKKLIDSVDRVPKK